MSCFYSFFFLIIINSARKYFHELLCNLQFNLIPCVSLHFQDMNICSTIGKQMMLQICSGTINETHEKFPEEFGEILTLFLSSKFLGVLKATKSFVRPHSSGKVISEQICLPQCPFAAKHFWLFYGFPISLV